MLETRHLQMVRDFRKMMGLPYNDTYHRLTETQAEFHFNMVKEEFEELKAAKTDVDELDAIVDAMVFALGALDHAGVMFTITNHKDIQIWNDLYVNYFSFIIRSCYEDNKGDESLLTRAFEIVMESNLSKACSSMEAAKAKQEEYEAKFIAEGDYESKCLIKENEGFICLYRRYPSGEMKLLKGDRFTAPEPKLAELLGV